MYCSNCGKPEQISDSYCRGCGEIIVNPKRGNSIAFGGTTPQQNVNTINILSVLAAIASLLAALWMYVSQMTEPGALYLGAAILLCNSAWHMSNFYIGMKLKRRLGKVAHTGDEADTLLQATKTRELLPETNEQDIIPASIIENTTRNLVGKNKR